MNIPGYQIIFLKMREYTWLCSEYEKALNTSNGKRLQRPIPAWIYSNKFWMSSEYARALNMP